MRWYRCELEKGTLRSLLVHLSEGQPSDASARREFRMLKAQDVLRPGLVIIHGTALAAEDFKEMQQKGVGLVWSPRSNRELYGGTTNVAAAQVVGLPTAIAPDWSPTGSAGMLQEINYAAARYGAMSSKQYVAMATQIPARIARLDDRIGSLEVDRLADLLVIRDRGGAPYDSIVTAAPADVRLVVVGSMPLYGDIDLMRMLLPGRKLDELVVCGTPKALYLGSLKSSPVATWEELRGELEKELQRYGSALSTIECN
jgi:cytosine/adenosine deaminase-related metal-dependent hydrolase